MSARGIPPVTDQLLSRVFSLGREGGGGYMSPGQAVLSCPGEVQYPSPVLPGGRGMGTQVLSCPEESTPTWNWIPPPGTGVPPPKTGLPPLLDWGTPPLPPPRSDLGQITGVFPQKVHGTSGSIMGWRWGTPPPTWTDRHL